MNAESWNVPSTEEGLQLVLSRLAEFHAAGEDREVGWGHLALAHLVKWVRSDNHQPPFERSHDLALQALEIFRAVGDRKGQGRALRAAAPFTDRETSDRMLAEADKIAVELGDQQEIAASLAAQGRAMGLRDRSKAAELAKQALAIYEVLGDVEGQAGCLFSLTIYLKDDRASFDTAMKGAELYRMAGNSKMAARCCAVAHMYGDSVEASEMEVVLLRGLADAQAAQATSLEQTLYAQLAKTSAKKGDAEAALRYQRWHDDLESADGLTPRQRAREHREMTKLLVAMAKKAGHNEAARMFEDELKPKRKKQ